MYRCLHLCFGPVVNDQGCEVRNFTFRAKVLADRSPYAGLMRLNSASRKQQRPNRYETRNFPHSPRNYIYRAFNRCCRFKRSIFVTRLL